MHYSTKLLLGITAICVVSQAHAFNLYYTEDRTYIPVVEGGGGLTYLNPDHVYEIGSTSSQGNKAKSLIEAAYSGWTVTQGSAAPGDVVVSDYSAYQLYNSGHVYRAGANLLFDYNSTASGFSSYRFVQVIFTNTPAQNSPNDGYLDPVTSNDSYPFYYNEGTEESGFHHSNYYHFVDHPGRDYDGSNAIIWNAACFLVEWDGSTSVTIHDGVYWGWDTIGYTGGGGTGMGGLVPEPSMAFILAPLALLAHRKRSKKG